MKTPHVAFAMFRSVALGGAWIAYDDGFARHRKIVGREEEFRTIAIRSRSDADSAMFSLCAESVRVDCVVDGDTLRFKGKKIRIVDIDAPETSKPACPAERQASEEARDCLVALLNAGLFSMTSGWRDRDRYGRKLRTVVRSGTSLGKTLVEESLVRSWDGPKPSWCDVGGA